MNPFRSLLSGVSLLAMAIDFNVTAALRRAEQLPPEPKIDAPLHPHRHRAQRRKARHGGLRSLGGHELLWRP